MKFKDFVNLLSKLKLKLFRFALLNNNLNESLPLINKKREFLQKLIEFNELLNKCKNILNEINKMTKVNADSTDMVIFFNNNKAKIFYV